MKSLSPRLTLASFALLSITTLALARQAFAADFPIKLERPTTKGEKYRVHVTTSDVKNVTITLAGKDPVVRNTEVKVMLVGDIEVLEVSPRGKEAKASCKVVSCKLSQANAQPTDLVPAGTMLVAFREEKLARVTNADGTALKPELERALELVLRVPDPTGVDEDATLGSKDRRKVGDEWDIKADQIIADGLRNGFPLTKNGVGGRVKLAETRKVGEVECLVLEANFNMTLEPGGKVPKMPPQLAGLTITNGTVRMSMTEVLPVDVAKQALSSIKGMTTDITLGGPNPDGSGPMQLSSKDVRTQETRRETK